MDTPEAMSVTSTEVSTLFRLPREVRDRIYYFCLVTEGAVIWPKEDVSMNKAHSILTTCKAVYDEATPILYQQNEFYFDHPSNCNIFRNLMDRNHTRVMSSVIFCIHEKSRKLWNDYLQGRDKTRSLKYDLPNLRRLKIFMKLSFWSPGRDPGQQFDEWPSYQNFEDFKDLCKALETNTRASISIFCTVIIPDPHLEFIKREREESLRISGETRAITRTLDLFGCQVCLSLLAQSEWRGREDATYSAMLISSSDSQILSN